MRRAQQGDPPAQQHGNTAFFAVAVGGHDLEWRRLGRQGLRAASRRHLDHARFPGGERELRRIKIKRERRVDVGGPRIEAVDGGSTGPNARDRLAVLAIHHLPRRGWRGGAERKIHGAIKRIAHLNLNTATRRLAKRVGHRAAQGHAIARGLEFVGEVLIGLGDPVDRERAAGDLVIGLDLASLVDDHKSHMLQLSGQRMLVNGAAAGSQHQKRNAVACGQCLQCVVMAGDHIVNAMLDQHRLHALVPARRLVVPERAMKKQNDRTIALLESGKGRIEPRQLFVGESWLDEAIAVLGVEDDEAREFEFDGVVQRSEERVKLVGKRSVVGVALSADKVVITRRWIEGHAQRAHDCQEILAFLGDRRMVARVTLHEVADAEHGIGRFPVEVMDRFTQISKSPVATGGSVGHDGNDLAPRRRSLDHGLSIACATNGRLLKGGRNRKCEEDSRCKKGGAEHSGRVPRQETVGIRAGKSLKQPLERVSRKMCGV